MKTKKKLSPLYVCVGDDKISEEETKRRMQETLNCGWIKGEKNPFFPTCRTIEGAKRKWERHFGPYGLSTRSKAYLVFLVLGKHVWTVVERGGGEAAK